MADACPISRVAPLGVVIPAHGHPGFLSEAIISACEQKCDQRVIVVVVDDGCRFAETREAVAALQPLYPDTLYYFRQVNTRLPGARNAGVRFLLDLYPDMDAIFFLDADNRIEEYALQNYRTALGDDPSVGWAYPDISFFGLSWGPEGFDTRETAPAYSKLKHLAGNVSEAGSLVRASVFRSGLFYDEDMKQGLEDWDYWLTLLEAGYVGVRAPQSGFLYRRRPESMLSASQRGVENILYKMRQKHAALFNPKYLLALEHAEDPVFAVYVEGSDSVRLTSDPLLDGKRISLEDFKEQVALKLHHEHEYSFPDYILVMTEEGANNWDAIKSYQRFCFWKMREFCCASTDKNHPDVVALKAPFEGGANADSVPSQALLVTARGLKQALRSGENLETKLFAALNIPLPVAWDSPVGELASSKKPGAEKVLDSLLVNLRTEKAWSVHLTRQYSGPAPVNIRQRLINDICAAPDFFPYPVCSARQRSVFVLNEADLLSGGCVGANLEHMIQAELNADREVGLVFERAGHNKAVSLQSEVMTQVSDIAIVEVPNKNQELRRYLGHDIPQCLSAKQNAEFSVLMRNADRVVFTGHSHALEMAGELRSYAAEIYVCDIGASSDKTRYLAYEHVIDKLLCGNKSDFDYLASMGFPAEKVKVFQ